MVEADVLAAALTDAADRGVQADYAEVLEVWRAERQAHLARLDPAVGLLGTADPLLLPVARLEAALARSSAGSTEAEVLASHLLRAAGARPEALLHEQACRLATLPTGPADPREVEAVAGHVRALASEIERVGTLADMAVARTRAAMAAQVASAVAGPDDIEAEARWRSAVGEALDAFDALPPQSLTGTLRGHLATLLRAVSSLQYGPERVVTLRRALDVLPPGTRLPERALVQFDLAFAVSTFGDVVIGDPLLDAPVPVGEFGDAGVVVQLLSGAADDGASAGEGAVTGRALMALAAVLHQHGQTDAAIESVHHAIGWFEAENDDRSVAQARTDLAAMQQA